jgi:hypothetical protein
MGDRSITQEDLESLADTYDKIRLIFKDQSLSTDKELSKDLESHLRSCISDLSEKLSRNSSDEAMELYTLHAKYKIYAICTSKISNLLQHFCPNSLETVEEVFKKLSDIVITIHKKAVLCSKSKQKAIDDYYTLQNELDQVLRAAEDLEKNVIV